MLGPFGSAPIALICSSRCTPLPSHAATILVGNSTCVLRELRPVRRAAFAVQRADEIDHAIGAFDEARELNGIEHVGFDHVDGQEGEMRAL